MKIILIVLKFLPIWLGGTEIATYKIAKKLVERKHEVHVITSLDYGLPLEELSENIYIHRIQRSRIRFVGATIYYINIFKKIKEINPDIIHVQTVSMGLPGLFAKKLLRIPYVVYARGSEIFLPWTFKKPMLKLILKNSDAVIALTSDMKLELKKIYDVDVTVIPNGIEINMITSTNDLNTIKKERHEILFVGTLRPVKGVEYLITAMKYVVQQNVNVLLRIVGDGEDRSKLKNLVDELNLGEYITFIGKVNNEDIPEYMNKADIFVLPSISEGFPVVILEAMASGLPIITTNLKGLAEIIETGKNGFLVQSMNPQEIAEKILILLEDKELRTEISQYNRKCAKKYSLENVIDELEVIYKNTI